MEYSIDNKNHLAQVWMSHADQICNEKKEQLRLFIEKCKSKKIFVCVYESGDGALLDGTKELLTYNFDNDIRNHNQNKNKTK